jgi:hypothetical protein
MNSEYLNGQSISHRHCHGGTHITHKPLLDPYLEMPCQSTLTEICITNIVEYLTPILTLLKELNDAFGPPFIQPIANTIESLIGIAQVRKLEH